MIKMIAIVVAFVVADVDVMLFVLWCEVVMLLCCIVSLFSWVIFKFLFLWFAIAVVLCCVVLCCVVML